MFDLDIRSLAVELLAMSKERGFTVATVESCTGGLVCGALTAISGSSAMVQGGLVTYANAAKVALAGLLGEHKAIQSAYERIRSQSS